MSKAIETPRQTLKRVIEATKAGTASVTVFVMDRVGFTTAVTLPLGPTASNAAVEKAHEVEKIAKGKKKAPLFVLDVYDWSRGKPESYKLLASDKGVMYKVWDEDEHTALKPSIFSSGGISTLTYYDPAEDKSAVSFPNFRVPESPCVRNRQLILDYSNPEPSDLMTLAFRGPHIEFCMPVLSIKLTIDC